MLKNNPVQNDGPNAESMLHETGWAWQELLDVVSHWENTTHSHERYHRTRITTDKCKIPTILSVGKDVGHPQLSGIAGKNANGMVPLSYKVISL